MNPPKRIRQIACERRTSPPSARKPASRNCVRAVGRHRPPRRNASSYRSLRRSGRPHLMHKQRSCETCRSRGGGIGLSAGILSRGSFSDFILAYVGVSDLSSFVRSRTQTVTRTDVRKLRPSPHLRLPDLRQRFVQLPRARRMRNCRRSNRPPHRNWEWRCTIACPSCLSRYERIRETGTRPICTLRAPAILGCFGARSII